MLSGCKETESTVSVDYEGAGKITSGDKIDCGDTCEATYVNPAFNVVVNGGYDIALKATPEEGYQFYGWSTVCGNDATCLRRIESRCTQIIWGQPCQAWDGVDVFAHAIFIPEGSVLDSSWYGVSTTCFVSILGELRCWGAQDFVSTVPAVSNATEVKVHDNVACVRGDSGLQCWGNQYVADVPNLQESGPFFVGTHQGCVIEQGQVLCWDSGSERIKNGPTLSNPISVTVLSAPAGVCAEDDNGTFCWGNHYHQQPAAPILSLPIQIASGEYNTCAIDAGELHCWGEVAGVSAISSQLVNPSISGVGWNELCVQDDNGLRCWNHDASPIALPGSFSDTDSFKQGGDHVCTTDPAGIECLKLNASEEPVRVIQTAGQSASQNTGQSTGQSTDIVDFSVHQRGGCAIEQELEGNIQKQYLTCWGDEHFWPAEFASKYPLEKAQAKVVTANNSAVCVGGDNGLECYYRKVSYLSSREPDNLSNITALAMSSSTTCAIHEEKVSCWGSNSKGQLNVPELANPRAISMGYTHACALDDTGVVCWGRIKED